MYDVGSDLLALGDFCQDCYVLVPYFFFFYNLDLVFFQSFYWNICHHTIISIMRAQKVFEIQISYAKTIYGKKEIEAVVKCLNESTQMGKYSRKFEAEIAKLFEKKYSLYVNSGSSALYIGVEAFNFPEGSEVITPALTFSTTVGCLVKNNLVPVFVDVEPLTFCIDFNQIEEVFVIVPSKLDSHLFID